MKKCPYCHAKSKQVKSGFNPSGSQRYLCKWCDRIYTPSPNPNGYSSEIRLQAIKLYEEGHSYRAIGKKLKVGTQSVSNWVHAGKEVCEES
ncbi:MAG: IS1 family transposase [Ardenticatenaceae bacterium]|nr:IS1 family transposase [Ardenticatenaceae bacterium]MCB9443299.1 IS1 family transposase [Ardenticatenaceae bacterium]